MSEDKKEKPRWTTSREFRDINFSGFRRMRHKMRNHVKSSGKAKNKNNSKRKKG